MSKLNAPPCIDVRIRRSRSRLQHAQHARATRKRTYASYMHTDAGIYPYTYISIRKRRIRLHLYVHLSYITYLCSHVIRVYRLSNEPGTSFSHRAPSGISHIGHHWHSITYITYVYIRTRVSIKEELRPNILIGRVSLNLW